MSLNCEHGISMRDYCRECSSGRATNHCNQVCEHSYYSACPYCRIKELEEEIEIFKDMDCNTCGDPQYQCKPLREQSEENQRLREALKQYADRKNWKYTHQYGWATNKFGPEKAQQALQDKGVQE